MELLNTLEEYMEADVEFVASKPAVIVEEVIPAEMNITMKQGSNSFKTRRNSPMEMTIEETLRLRADEEKIERIQL
jgi:cell division protein FtsZ